MREYTEIIKYFDAYIEMYVVQGIVIIDGKHTKMKEKR